MTDFLNHPLAVLAGAPGTLPHAMGGMPPIAPMAAQDPGFQLLQQMGISPANLPLMALTGGPPGGANPLAALLG